MNEDPARERESRPRRHRTDGHLPMTLETHAVWTTARHRPGRVNRQPGRTRQPGGIRL